jgi:hypothetical protein
MFGSVGAPVGLTSPDTGPLGDQIRGFGYQHDGTSDTVFHFLNGLGFAPTEEVGFPLENPDAVRRDVEQFLFAFDSDMAPIVGQQITLTRTNAAAVSERIDLLEARAGAPFTSKLFGGTVTECDLVAKVSIAGRPTGFLYNAARNEFVSSSRRISLYDPQFRALARAPGQEITFTCVPPGSGPRIAATR